MVGSCLHAAPLRCPAVATCWLVQLAAAADRVLPAETADCWPCNRWLLQAMWARALAAWAPGSRPTQACSSTPPAATSKVRRTAPNAQHQRSGAACPAGARADPATHLSGMPCPAAVPADNYPDCQLECLLNPKCVAWMHGVDADYACTSDLLPCPNLVSRPVPGWAQHTASEPRLCCARRARRHAGRPPCLAHLRAATGALLALPRCAAAQGVQARLLPAVFCILRSGGVEI